MSLDMTQEIRDKMNISLRDVTADDIAACAQICHEAFTDVAEKHNFPTDFPSTAVAEGMLNFMVGNPGFYGVVAELDGEIVGSNFLDERGEIVGLGPIAVSVNGQNSGVGKVLMQHCIDRSREHDARGVRLLQAAYHNRSLSLYTRLGFDVQDVLSTLQGPAINLSIDGYSVRLAEAADIEACNSLCRQAHGHDRQQELQDAVDADMATVAESDGTIRGFSTLLGYTGFSVAENNDALKALIGAAREFVGPGILVPSGNGDVMRWCLEHGLRVIQQMTLMTTGYFQRPTTPYMPSILY